MSHIDFDLGGKVKRSSSELSSFRRGITERHIQLWMTRSHHCCVCCRFSLFWLKREYWQSGFGFRGTCLNKKRSKVYYRIRVQYYFPLVASLNLCPLSIDNMAAKWTSVSKTKQFDARDSSEIPRSEYLFFPQCQIKCWEIVLYSQSSSFTVFVNLCTCLPHNYFHYF